MADIKARSGEIKRYVAGWTRLPIQPPPPEEQSKGEKMFADLVAAVEEVPRRERKCNEWIHGGAWALVNQRSSLQKQGKLSMVEGRRLGRHIKALLQSDRDNRALQAGHTIMVHLGDKEERKALGALRGWHKEVDPAASKPCYRALDKQTEEREELYTRRNPPGTPVPSNARRTPREDHPPLDEELRRATKKSSNGRTGRATK